MSTTLALRPITLKEARRFVGEHHRHSTPPRGGLFAVAVENGGLCGVAIVGRPVARGLSDGFTAEVTRVCTDGSRNACSMLYGAAVRAARALGYRRVVTYTLASEAGTSLRATGWEMAAELKARSWACADHRRGQQDLWGNERANPQDRRRWEKAL
ncbi:MAG: hypothetical protein QF464_08655 [Myxococcota bacterium]|jgi:hypothetical protein|nr:hypothetical protein [Myxococcota bacterium]